MTYPAGIGFDITMMGLLTLGGAPTADLHAVTKQYADTALAAKLAAAGDAMSGTFTGAPTFSGVPAFNCGTAGSTDLGIASTISIGTAVAANGTVTIGTPNGSNINLLPRGTASVQIGGGTGPLKAGTVTLSGVTATGAGNTINNPFSQNMNIAGTLTTAGVVGANSWLVNSDGMARSNGLMVHSLYSYNFGGAGYTGSRGMIVSSLQQTGAISGGGLAQGIQSSVTLTNTWGGTSLGGANAKGAATTFNGFLALTAGLTNGAGGSVCEWDVNCVSGSAFQAVVGNILVHTTGHAASGAYGQDVGYQLSDQTGVTVANGWDYAFAAGGNAWPIKPTGTIFGLIPSLIGSSPANLKNGVDLTFGIFSGAPYKSVWFSVDNSGNIQSGTGYINNSTAGIAVDASGSVATAVALVSGGSNWPTDGNTYYATDSNGGIYSLTLSGGAVTAVAFYNSNAPVCKGATPSNPVTLSPYGPAASWGATGLTVNLTWSLRNGLSLNPTGQKIGFNGTSPVAKPTITGSKASNAALASLLTALAAYGLLTDSTT